MKLNPIIKSKKIDNETSATCTGVVDNIEKFPIFEKDCICGKAILMVLLPGQSISCPAHPLATYRQTHAIW